MHVYDMPGSQLDEAVTIVVKAFKWRKSYGVENLDDSALNRFFSLKIGPQQVFALAKLGSFFLKAGGVLYCRILV